MPTSSSHWGRRSTPWPPGAQSRTLTDPLGLGEFMSVIVNTVTPGTELTPTVPATGTPLQNGNLLQQALTNAAIGAVIVLKSGGTYETASPNGFTFPPKGASWDNRRVTVCCSRIADLTAGTRVSPSQTNNFAKLVTGVKGPTLNFSGSRGWTLQGLEVSYTAAVQTGASVQRMVDLTNADADLTLERCWIHPRESVTAPSSIYRAAAYGIAGIQTVKNFRFADSYLDGFTGWGYNNVINWAQAITTDAGSHLRIKNNFLQAYRTMYVEGHPGSADLVIQRNTFDSPPVWETLTNPLGTVDGTQPATIMQDDHRHLIIYAGTDILVVGNRFTGATRGSWGMFFYQIPGGTCRRVRFLSNFLDGPKAFLAQLSNWNTPYPASDIAFVNNLIRGVPYFSGMYETGWSIEFGGPAPRDIAPGVPLTAGHGLNILHNTIRQTFNYMLHPQGEPSAFCDIRYNISFPGFYYLQDNVAVDFPNLLLASNRFIGGSGKPYVSSDQEFATDAAAGLSNGAAGDAGGAITNYALTSLKAGAEAGTDHGCDIPALQAALDGTSTDWDYPELPRVFLDTTYALPGGTVRTVAAGNATDFQAKLDAAVPGDVIVLAANSTYTNASAFRLRNKTGSGWIYITSSAYANLPAPGTRVTPAAAANMPRIQTTTTEPAIYCDPGAHHYRFVGCDIASVLGSGAQTYWVIDTTGDNTVAGMPHDITFDRCYIHGHPTNGTIRGLRMNGAAIAVIDSWLTDFVDPINHADTQTLYGIQGGPFKIVNNHLEAAGENLMFGGDDTPIAQMVPHDIEIRNNHFFKPLNWKNGDPSYNMYVGTKNMLELKCAIRVLIEDNLFENFWVEVQGMAVTMTPRSQYGTNPWNRITDVTFRRNRFVNNTGGGLCIQGDDNYQVTQQAARFLIQHNDFDTCGTTANTAIFQIYKGPRYGGPLNVIIDHNTCLMGRGFLHSDGGGWDTAVDYHTYHLVFTNNILARGFNPMYDGGSPSIGGPTIQSMFNFWFPGALVRNNLMIDTIADGMGPMPPGNFSVPNNASIGFIAGTHTPAPGSIGYRAGTEGLSLGAELTVVAAPPPVPFPQTPIIDTTTRANEATLGTNGGLWGTRVNVQLLSNRIRAITNFTYNFATADTTTSADCEAYMTVATLPAIGGTVSLYLRATDLTGTYYTLQAYSYQGSNTFTGLYIGKRVAGGSESFMTSTPSVTLAAGSVLGFRATGSSLQAFINGTLILSWVDASVTAAGKLIYFGNDATSALTAIGGGPLPVPSPGGTITAANLSSTEVQRVLDAATAGMTVILPAGTGHWTAQVFKALPPNVTIRGAGTTAIGGGDQTVIIDDYAANAPVFSLSAAATGVLRLTGVTLQGGVGGVKNNGYFNVSGYAGSQVRIDHCHLNGKTYTPNGSGNEKNRSAIGSGIIGVLDHCVLDYRGTGAVYVYNGTNSGNAEWAQPTNFGSANFFFFEDNIVIGTDSSRDARVTDSYTGGRWVIRFNTLTACCINEDHATGHGGNDRGRRAGEAYGNYCQVGPTQTEPNFVMSDQGSGTTMIWGNYAPGVFKNCITFHVTRCLGQSGGGTYNQTPTPNGWGYAGTAYSGTGSNWDGNTDPVTGYPCLDQPGRGQGDLIFGDNNTVFVNIVNTRTGTIAYPQQAVEPIYIWANTMSPAPGWGGTTYPNLNNTGSRVQANREYYAQASGIQTSPTSPFNGTSGCGWGTLANRPTTCTTGVGYFATDQGNWNHSATNPYGVQQNGASGVLYIATATNTWALAYTPYTYPHPLNTG
jgi:hypothetical protein